MMDAAQRRAYHGRRWPAACAARDWHAKDEELRRQVTHDCMTSVRGPRIFSSSDPRFGQDEITALFCYLEHLANPSSLDLAARWTQCCQDYRSFNRARQADYHERSLYGTGKNRLDKNRFAGRTSANAHPLNPLDPQEIYRRHLTVKSRRDKAEREASKLAKARAQMLPVPPDGTVILLGPVVRAPRRAKTPDLAECPF